MNKLATYLLALAFVGTYCGLASASTDFLSNALTQSNSFLKEAGLVQKKYSGVAREYVTNKTGDLNNLGGERAKKYQEKAKSLSEKAAKLQKWMQDAQEKKAELERQYNELNAQAMEYKAMADDAMAAGQSIKESYKNIKSDIESNVDGLANEVKGVSKMAQDVKDQALGDSKSVADVVGSSDSSSAAKELSEDALVASEGLENTVTTNTPLSTDAQVTPFRRAMQAEARQKINLGDGQTNVVAVENLSAAPVSSFSPAVRSAVSQVSEIPQYNQADAIRSASYMAGQSQISDIAAYEQLSIPEAMRAENDVSAADIMAVAATKPDLSAPVEIQKSKLNIEEQLLQASNKVSSSKVQKNVEMQEMPKTAEKAALRKKFGGSELMQSSQPMSEAVKAVPTNGEAKVETVKISEKRLIEEKTDDKAL